MPIDSNEIEEGDATDDAPQSAPRFADPPLQPTCPGCGYDLSGTLEAPEQRCPECGRAWTVEELALQHARRIADLRSPSRFVAAVGPGLSIGGLLLIGLIFGPPVNWLAFPAAVVLVVLAVVEWARDLHRKSFERPRGRVGRFVYVTGLTSLLIAGNVVLVGMVALLLLVMIASCGWLGHQ